MKAFDLGILGGGQLARMSIQAAQRMGLKCLTLDPGKVTPASQIAPAIEGRLDDPEAIALLMAQCERITLENEFIPAAAIESAFGIATFDPANLIPGVQALATIQDKLEQRRAMARAGVPSPRAVPLEGDGELAIQDIGFPMVLKARFGGYDGKGTRYARSQDELAAYGSLWQGGGWLAETFVPFRRELAAMVFVDPRGAGCFPTMETIQSNHVCDLVFPGGVDASEVALAAVEAVGGLGLFGVEMFELPDGSISINELAPRPHNTGHYTLDWGGVSQFEQHVRLALGLPTVAPLGGATCMANLLGRGDADDFRAGIRAALAVEPEARIHWYGKAESRPGRKMGHLNVVGENFVDRARRARDAFYSAV